nr:PEP/pyruvate-binding domain-containing protein [candidate division Zixibacteria bacterium]
MADNGKSTDKLLEALKQRANELNCLYRIEEILVSSDESLDEICRKIIQAMPWGWQYPDICQAEIILEDKTFSSPDLIRTEWVLTADILVQEMVIGTLSVYYSEKRPEADHGPFLKEESRLIKTISDRLGHFILQYKMKQVFGEFNSESRPIADGECTQWQVIMDMLRKTDRNLFLSISRKMLNHLCWSGVTEAELLLRSFGSDQKQEEEELREDWNIPHRRRVLGFSADFSSAAFKIASDHMSDREIMRVIQKWIEEDKLSFLVQVVNRNLSLAEVADAIRRYHHLAPDEPEVFSPSKRGIQVSLIRRFLSDQLQYINIAKNFIEVRDFYHLLQNLIFSAESQGKLGGKSAGMFLASQILKKKAKDLDLLGNVKIPKTWYITSDVVLHFMHYNDLDEVVEQKYKDLNQVRLEYPHIVQTFKNGRFPVDIKKSLSVALDDFGDRPLIVRSSSLLEDRIGAAFSGKYKSLFLANQGSKQKRLDALMDAIAEVYASTFSPDPIEYRSERGLIDFGEEMGVIIQEVVGTRVGKYFLPSFAGVAFSNNEFRWSPRIQRKDGLVRIVPGLGTRAVDRLSDDYPILIAPGQPGLRVNVSPDEVIRYSPKKIDVINLENDSFESIDIDQFIKRVGYEIPAINNMVSIFRDNRLTKPLGMNIDFENEDLVITFEGLLTRTPFIKQMQTMLKVLEETLGRPVDIEFASDGEDFYLLQCRPQSYSGQSAPEPIPKDIPAEKIVFSANRHISNGKVNNITHIVYVDPERYGALPDRGDMIGVARAVGKLNKLLPKRQFILMGPGRWGSRGDIKLGVNVTYSEINNTSLLIEIARQKGGYVPDLSFGTHFFQDLVEAEIRYLPLYPDDKGIIFNEQFLLESPNFLADILPEHANLAETIRLIDIPRTTGGQVMKVLMNADLKEAVGLITEPTDQTEIAMTAEEIQQKQKENHWRWRMQMVEKIAGEIDPSHFGIVAFYILGSTKNASARPDSDIDIMVHFRGDQRQLNDLKLWFSAWSSCLEEINFMRTGYRVANFLDVQIITDEDIEKKSNYAAKIGAVTDAAQPLPIGPRNQ